MSPDTSVTFGRTAGECARSAVVLAGLGLAAVWGVGRLFLRLDSPLSAPLIALGLSPLAVPVAGTLVVLALAVSGYRKALQSRPQFRLTAPGLEVTDAVGRYLLAWDNIAGCGEAAGGALGIRVRDREAVVATHAGTERQREWLRTLPPYGEWDFLYPRSDLGRPVGEILEWLRAQTERVTDVG